jgi:hypothetical protein
MYSDLLTPALFQRLLFQRLLFQRLKNTGTRSACMAYVMRLRPFESRFDLPLYTLSQVRIAFAILHSQGRRMRIGRGLENRIKDGD